VRTRLVGRPALSSGMGALVEQCVSRIDNWASREGRPPPSCLVSPAAQHREDFGEHTLQFLRPNSPTCDSVSTIIRQSNLSGPCHMRNARQLPSQELAIGTRRSRTRLGSVRKICSGAPDSTTWPRPIQSERNWSACRPEHPASHQFTDRDPGHHHGPLGRTPARAPSGVATEDGGGFVLVGRQQLVVVV